MTSDERVRPVVDFGFTERQARFLVLVIRHAGVWVPRQYASFAGIANGGHRCNAFFDGLVTRGYATGTHCVHNRAQLYHVHHKALYCAIGELTSRYRRGVSPRLALERLMLLDAVLASPDLIWLATLSEKLAYLASLTRSAPIGHPQKLSGDPKSQRRHIGSDKFPILSGLRPNETVVVEGSFLLKAEADKARGEGEHEGHER